MSQLGYCVFTFGGKSYSFTYLYFDILSQNIYRPFSYKLNYVPMVHTVVSGKIKHLLIIHQSSIFNTSGME